jgi:hypothetical protein
LEEFFRRAAKELHEQQVIKRMVCVFWRTHQPEQPVSLDLISTRELAMEAFKQGG